MQLAGSEKQLRWKAKVENSKFQQSGEEGEADDSHLEDSWQDEKGDSRKSTPCTQSSANTPLTNPNITMLLQSRDLEFQGALSVISVSEVPRASGTLDAIDPVICG